MANRFVINKCPNNTVDIPMKRIAALIRFLIYLVPPTGATLHYRYPEKQTKDRS